MSRSYRRTPKRSYDFCRSEKPYKIIWHRKMRASMRQCLHRARTCGYDGLLLPHEREIFSDYDFGRARRCWFDPQAQPEWMRK